MRVRLKGRDTIAKGVKFLNRDFILKNNRAKQIRLNKNLTIEQASKEMKQKTKHIISGSVIRNYENRKNVMDDDFRKALADFYGVSLRYMDGY